MPRPSQYFHARGFLFRGRAPLSDPEAYNDFINRTWPAPDLVSDLDAGVLPYGLIIQAEGGGAGVVVDDPAGGQKIAPIFEVI